MHFIDMKPWHHTLSYKLLYSLQNQDSRHCGGEQWGRLSVTHSETRDRGREREIDRERERETHLKKLTWYTSFQEETCEKERLLQHNLRSLSFLGRDL
jgi:hypothetical protein